MFVGIAEARDPERRRVGEGSAKVSSRSACVDRVLERVNDPHRIVIQQLSGERRVVRPAIHVAARNEQFRQLVGRFLTQRNEINRLAPGGRFLGATSRYHLADDRRQHNRRMVPANQVETLERLVDEVERVSGFGKRPLGCSRKQCIGEPSRRDTPRNRREQRPLGRLAMAHVCPTPQPALERGRVQPAAKRRTVPPRRLAIAVRRHAARTVDQSEIGLLLRQQRQKIGQCRQDRQTHAPAVAVLHPEQRPLPHDIGL